MNTDPHRFKNVDGASCSVALVLGVLLLLTSCGDKFVHSWTSEELNISVSSQEETIFIGDLYEVTFTVIHPTNGIVTFPEFGREKDIVVLNRTNEKQLFVDGHEITELNYSLTSFRIGDHIVCTNPVIYRHDGITETNNLPQITITVVSSLEADASSEIADIKPIHKLPGRIPNWVWIMLGTAATAFLIGLISSKLWKNRAVIIPRAPATPPHVLAFKALEKLKGKGLLEKDECNPFYTELSRILRTYLEGRFLLNAPDETTEEIVEEMSKSPELDGNQRNILQDFMRQADMVKFAKGHPDRTTMESAFSTTQQFVEETKQSENLAAKERKEPKGNGG